MDNCNLEEIAVFNDRTVLCISRQDNSLCVVKNEPPEAAPIYNKLMSIRDPHLAPVLDVKQTPDGITVFQSYISGISLDKLLLEKKQLTEDRAIEIAFDICEGLSALHKAGIVHRDINPNNIVIENSGSATVIDFGIARQYSCGKDNDTMILGTPGYAAPEQFGFSQSNEKTDIYAVGVLMNVMLTGELPNVRRADGSLKKIIGKCIEVDSRKRYKTIDALKKALKVMMPDNSGTGKFLSKLPGFRGKTVFSAVTGVIGYSLAAFLCIFLLATSTPAEIPGMLAVLFFILVFPFLVCSDFKFSYFLFPVFIFVDMKNKRMIRAITSIISILAGIILFGWLNRPA